MLEERRSLLVVEYAWKATGMDIEVDGRFADLCSSPDLVLIGYTAGSRGLVVALHA
jgi:hypothetical protein